ncbi:MAG: endonuclease III domain-containing protein [Thermotogae bacterium]|nr:endonuclease III domain-containing protein [Thermotogota bacterium]
MLELNKVYRRLLNIYGPQHWWPAETPFEVLVGAILTQNTAWKNVERAIRNLKEMKLLQPIALLSAPLEALEQAIKPAGFYRLKAKRLKEATKAFKELWPADHMPLLKLRSRLLQVHGIGPETADSIILYAFEKPTFVVDTYTKRFFHRLGFFKSEKTPYEVVKRFVESQIPPNLQLYKEFHALIVEHSKRFCRKSPHCDECPLVECPRSFFTAGITTFDHPSSASR